VAGRGRDFSLLIHGLKPVSNYFLSFFQSHEKILPLKGLEINFSCNDKLDQTVRINLLANFTQNQF
jgi:hypothetical protein